MVTGPSDRVCCALLVLIWIVIAALPGPVGDFPLNDDWSYGLAVRSLAETGHLQLTGWVSMPLVAQVAWGYLFCLPSGFSFTALRFSTLVLGLVGVLFSYGLLRQARAASSTAFLGAVTIAVNPLYVVLSHSFMTDVPFFGLAIASAFFLARSLRTDSRRDYVPGIALAVAATLVRQVGVIIPVAFAVAYLVRMKANTLQCRTLTRAALPAAIVFTTLLLYRVWLDAYAGLPELYDAHGDLSRVMTTAPIQHILNAARGGYVTTVYLGLFLLPISVVVLLQQYADRLRRARFLAVFVALAAIGVGVAVQRAEFMPLTGNVLFNSGLGPPTLRDVYILKLNHLPSAPRGVWIALTVLATVSMAALLSHVVLGWGALFPGRRSPEDARRSSFSVLVLLAALLHMAPMAGAGFLDRYMIILVPLALTAVLQAARARDATLGPLQLRVGLAVAFLLGALSVAGTHDYLSWNRARWAALEHLTEDVGVRPTDVDGGFEFNGYYLYDEKYRVRSDVSWWWVQDDAYVVAFGPIGGYEAAWTYSFRRWLPPGEGRVLVLRKATAATD